jgi:DNA-binding HxlR family transcriptional regulator
MLLAITCEMQAKICYGGGMAAKKADPKRRSGCPLNASVEMLGDRWSLLIVRDMMIRGFQTYKEFLASDERIATNILADRLRKLEAHGIITTQPDAADGRKLTYLLTPKGIDLAPVLAEMVLWAARHEETGNQPLVRALQTNKQGVVTEVRDRWAQKKNSPSRLTKFRVERQRGC